MNEIVSKDIALKFCEICNWTYEAWVTHRKLFDDNKDIEKKFKQIKYFTSRLSIITQEYCLLQISKLHDPAIMKNNLCLTIDYIIRFGNWGDKLTEVNKIKDHLSGLWSKIKSARNTIIAHNNLETISTNQAQGKLSKNLDKKYFNKLQDLVNMVHEKWFSGPYPFNDLAITDVHEFLAQIKTYNKAIQRTKPAAK